MTIVLFIQILLEFCLKLQVSSTLRTKRLSFRSIMIFLCISRVYPIKKFSFSNLILTRWHSMQSSLVQTRIENRILPDGGLRAQRIATSIFPLLSFLYFCVADACQPQIWEYGSDIELVLKRMLIRECCFLLLFCFYSGCCHNSKNRVMHFSRYWDTHFQSICGLVFSESITASSEY